VRCDEEEREGTEGGCVSADSLANMRDAMNPVNGAVQVQRQRLLS
jgi:hypothetical protein